MFKVRLIFRSPSGDYLEDECEFRFLEDAIDFANEVACSNTGFGIDYWDGGVQIGDSKIFYFYPEQDNRHIKYVLFICALQ